MAYEIKWTDSAKADLKRLPAYLRKAITSAQEALRHQPAVETRNRKRLAAPIEGLPTPTWEARVGNYRILYTIEEDRTVKIFQVIFKGAGTTAEAVARGKKP